MTSPNGSVKYLWYTSFLRRLDTGKAVSKSSLVLSNYVVKSFFFIFVTFFWSKLFEVNLIGGLFKCDCWHTFTNELSHKMYRTCDNWGSFNHRHHTTFIPVGERMPPIHWEHPFLSSRLLLKNVLIIVCCCWTLFRRFYFWTHFLLCHFLIQHAYLWDVLHL